MKKKAICLIVAILMLAFAVFTFASCNKMPSVTSDNFLQDVANIRTKPNGVDDLIDANAQQIIDLALEDDATEDQKKDAVMLLYTIANNSRINAEKSLMVQNSIGGNAMGKIYMHGFTLQNGDAWYYQLASQAAKGDVAGFELIAQMLGSIAGNLQVAYTSGNGKYYYAYIMGTDTQLDCSPTIFPYADYIIPTGKEPKEYASFEAYQNERNCLVSQLELNNMYVCREILADGVTIEKRTDNNGDDYYAISFDIDFENGDRELLDRFMAMSKKDLAKVPTIKINHTIDSWRAELDVWDNGYAKSFTSYEHWMMHVLAFDVDSSPCNMFEYVWNEDEIMKILKQDQKIDSMTSLGWDMNDYISYYSRPESVHVFDWFTLVICLAAGIVGALGITALVLGILFKKGKLPKLEKAWREHVAKQKAFRQELKEDKLAKKEQRQQKIEERKAKKAKKDCENVAEQDEHSTQDDVQTDDATSSLSADKIDESLIDNTLVGDALADEQADDTQNEAVVNANAEAQQTNENCCEQQSVEE